MKSLMRTAIVVVAVSCFILDTALAAESHPFSPEERVKIQERIAPEITKSQHNAYLNQALDVGFKVSLLLIAVGATIGAAYAATYQTHAAPTWLKITNTTLTGIATALSAFAFTQFNFAQRESNWQIKLAALRGCSFELEFGEPDKREFLQQLGEIMGWDAYKQSTPLTSKIAKGAATSTPTEAASSSPADP